MGFQPTCIVTMPLTLSLCQRRLLEEPPASPLFGGAWERMVRAVKKALWNILKNRQPREEVLRTTLKAAENIVNSRPLTYVSSDPNDPESLTPNHFLRGGAYCGSSAEFGAGVGDEAEFMRSQFLKAQLYVNEFWKRWSHEVLPDLVRKTKWYDSKEPVRMGDVVLLIDDQQPRNTWLKGIITKTSPEVMGLFVLWRLPLVCRTRLRQRTRGPLPRWLQ